MDEKIKSLRDINVFMSKINIGQYNAICSTLIIIDNDVLGSFCAIVSEIEKSNNSYLICKYSLRNNEILPLSKEEAINILDTLILHDERFNFKTKIDYSRIKELILAIYRDIILFANTELKIIDNVVLLLGVSPIKEDRIETLLDIGSTQIEVKNISAVKMMECATCIFDIENMNDRKEGLLSFSLYTEAKVVFNIGEKYYESGSIVKVDLIQNGIKCFLIPYTMELLATTRMERLAFENIRNPKTILRYLLESSDFDITKVNIEGETLEENIFLVVMAVKNMKIQCEPFSIGDVRIAESIYVSQEFEDMIKSEVKDNYFLIWTNQIATNHFEAISKAKSKIKKVADLLVFFIKNDILYSNFGATDEMQNWEIRNHTPQIEFTDHVYVENCLLRESVIAKESEIKIPLVLNYCQADSSSINNDFIEATYENNIKGDKATEKIFHAIHWVNKSWSADNNFDKIIYCVMALEFCLNREKGNSIIDDILEGNGIEKDISKNLRKDIVKMITENIRIFDIELKDEILNEIEKRVRSQVTDSLSQASFMSKLKRLIERLKIPITNEEIILIESARKLRNGMVHGLDMETTSLLKIKKLSGVVSRIISYKLKDLTKV